MIVSIIEIFKVVISLLPLFRKMVDLVLSLVPDQRDEYLKDLHSAIAKARDEKDPSDLSALINRKL